MSAPRRCSRSESSHAWEGTPQLSLTKASGTLGATKVKGGLWGRNGTKLLDHSDLLAEADPAPPPGSAGFQGTRLGRKLVNLGQKEKLILHYGFLIGALYKPYKP